MDQSTCDEICMLVELARVGDGRAWGQLYRRFARFVWKLVLPRVRYYDQAADLVQEVFLRAFRKLPQLREPARFVGWLRKIAVNSVNNWFTNRRPFTGYSIALADLKDRSLEPAAALQRLEESLILQAGLAEMKPWDRVALEAFYINDLTLKQISAATGKPLDTVKSRLHYARRRLAAIISRRLPL